MLVYKCDRCKKVIRSNKDKVRVDYSKELKFFYFCDKCAASIIEFLKHSKLIEDRRDK